MSLLAALFGGAVLLFKTLPLIDLGAALILVLWTVAVLAALFGLFWGLVNSEKRGLVLSVVVLALAGLRLMFIEV